MDKPNVAQKGPYEMDIAPGRYFWCACGLSKDQPFCDGSHKGTPYRPVKATFDKPEKVWFCGCKQTAGQPFCDGTHNGI